VPTANSFLTCWLEILEKCTYFFGVVNYLIDSNHGDGESRVGAHFKSESYDKLEVGSRGRASSTFPYEYFNGGGGIGISQQKH
jgi:hypothetical protein